MKLMIDSDVRIPSEKYGLKRVDGFDIVRKLILPCFHSIGRQPPGVNAHSANR